MVEVVLPTRSDLTEADAVVEVLHERQLGHAVALDERRLEPPRAVLVAASSPRGVEVARTHRSSCRSRACPPRTSAVARIVLPGPGSPVQLANHRAVRSDSVMLAHTSSIGARNDRVSTRSRPSVGAEQAAGGLGGHAVLSSFGSGAWRAPVGRPRPPRHGRRWTDSALPSRPVHLGLEGVERRVHAVAELRQPRVELGQRRDVEAVVALTAVGLVDDEPGLAEHPEVAADRGAADLEGPGDGAGRPAARAGAWSGCPGAPDRRWPRPRPRTKA